MKRREVLRGVAEVGSRRRRGAETPLSEEQRELVRKSLGLVTYLVKRRLPGGSFWHGHYLFDDAFQEGCLGLIAAVKAYKGVNGWERAAVQVAAGGPCLREWSAVAAAHIRKAVRTALIPPTVMGKGYKRGVVSGVERGSSMGWCKDVPVDGDGGSYHWNFRQEGQLGFARSLPLLYYRPNRSLDHLPAVKERRHDECLEEILECRMYEIIVGAICCCAMAISCTIDQRTAGAQVLRTLIEERVRVPEAEDRTALRRIASIAVSCVSVLHRREKALVGHIRQILACDQELAYIFSVMKGDADLSDWSVECFQAQLRFHHRRTLWNRLRALSVPEREEVLSLDYPKDRGLANNWSKFNELSEERIETLFEQVTVASFRRCAIKSALMNHGCRSAFRLRRCFVSGDACDKRGQREEGRQSAWTKERFSSRRVLVARQAEGGFRRAAA